MCADAGSERPVCGCLIVGGGVGGVCVPMQVRKDVCGCVIVGGACVIVWGWSYFGLVDLCDMIDWSCARS